MKSLDELDASLLKPGDKLHKYDVIIAGDFNAPNISWDNLDASANFLLLLLLLLLQRN